MLNFTLANFYNGYVINRLFLEVISTENYKLKSPIAFNQIGGSFPFSSWNGGLNSCITPEIALNNQISECYAGYMTATRLDFSNMMLTQEDFYNNYNRIMLEHGATGATAIELCNLQLYEYIKANYPTYQKFILAPNAATLMGDQFTPEVVNVILENPDFQLVSLSPRLAKDKNFLQQIKAKNKIEICVNPLCSSLCKHQDECVINESKLQYDYSEKSAIISCPRRNAYYNNPNTIEIKDLKEYTQMGITHFRLAECPFPEISQYFIFLVKYFIKEEYQQELIERGLLMMTSMGGMQK